MLVALPCCLRYACVHKAIHAHTNLHPQFLGGLYAYLWPKAPLPTRVALGPVHRFTGAAIWVCGLATMAVSV